jgi:hypothetical protein
VPCTEGARGWRRRDGLLAALGLLAAWEAGAVEPAASAAEAADGGAAPVPIDRPRTRPPRVRRLPPPAVARSWEEFKVQAARRMVAAHPDSSYMGTPPEPLLGIPVIEIQLHADGRVRSTRVLREPVEAKETIQLALDVIHDAAPYGSVARLPQPWKFVEVFLFDDDRRFKPATLDR